jgi:outer membrane receptor protein involved in Fe transport
MISISGFYKQFHNPIEIVQFVKAKNNVQPRNVGDARAMGVEVELRQSLGYLTDALAPLSVNANVTYTKSSVDIAANELESRRESAREGEEVAETRAMAGQSPYIINAGLSYKGKENGIEAGLYYNVQGKTLQIVGVNDRPDVYSDPFHSLNVTASKTLGKEDRLSIGIKADNILNDDKLEYFDAYKADNKVFSKLSPGRSFSVSFGYKF